MTGGDVNNNRKPRRQRSSSHVSSSLHLQHFPSSNFALKYDTLRPLRHTTAADSTPAPLPRVDGRLPLLFWLASACCFFCLLLVFCFLYCLCLFFYVVFYVSFFFSVQFDFLFFFSLFFLLTLLPLFSKIYWFCFLLLICFLIYVFLFHFLSY